MVAALVFTGQFLARQLEGVVDTVNDDRVVGAELTESTVSGSTIIDGVALVLGFRAGNEREVVLATDGAIDFVEVLTIDVVRPDNSVPNSDASMMKRASERALSTMLGTDTVNGKPVIMDWSRVSLILVLLTVLLRVLLVEGVCKDRVVAAMVEYKLVLFKLPLRARLVEGICEDSIVAAMVEYKPVLGLLVGLSSSDRVLS